jgi:short-subunit dehydrogenase
MAMNQATAVITGASSGIGRAVAQRLATRGCGLVILARRENRLYSVAEQLRTSGAACRVLALDLGRPEQVEAAALELASKPVDILINSGGEGACTRFLDADATREREMMQVHYHAPATLIRHLLPGMLDRGRGHVINIASISAKMGPWGHSSYASAKAAMTALTQSLAADYPDSGVQFSYVNPGVVRTEFFEKPGMAVMAAQVRQYGISVERVADAIIALLDRPRLELCVPRSYRLLDLFKAMSPTWCHRLVARGSRPATIRPATPQPDTDARSAV